MTQNAKPSGETLMAIELFYKIRKYEKNIEKLEVQLGNYVSSIPKDEGLEYYIKATTVND